MRIDLTAANQLAAQALAVINAHWSRPDNEDRQHIISAMKAQMSAADPGDQDDATSVPAAR